MWGVMFSDFVLPDFTAPEMFVVLHEIWLGEIWQIMFNIILYTESHFYVELY